MKILILILFIPFLIHAQDPISSEVEVQLGTPYPVIDAEHKDYFSLDKDRSVAVKTYKNRVSVQVFDTKTGKELYMNVYIDFPKKMDHHEILEINDKAYYVYSYYDRKTKYRKIAAREIRVSKGTLGSSKTLVSDKEGFSSVNVLALGGPISNSSYVNFEIIKSADESMFLIQNPNYNYKEDSKIAFDYYVFDDNMKEVWNKTKVLLPYHPEEAGCLASMLANTGTIYVMFRVWRAQQFEICSIDKNSNVKNKRLNFPKNIYPAIVKLKEDKDGNIVCSIPYEKDVTVVSGGEFIIQGFLHFKCSPENELLVHLDAMFSPDFNAQYMSKKESKTEKKEGVVNLKLLEMLTQKDGSTILVCEQQVIQTSFGPNTSTSYNYDNIVLAKFNSDASLAWMKKIPKKQRKGGLLADKSIKYVYTEGQHYVLYVDNPKNKTVEPDASPAVYKSEEGGFLTLCKIDDATGEYEKYTVLNMKDVEGKVVDKFSVNRLYAIDAKEQLFMMECYIKGKKDANIRIKLN